MGCGSSAAALLAGVMLANHFGDLGWTWTADVWKRRCRREGHPDNVAACYLGGMTASAGGWKACRYGDLRTKTCHWNLFCGAAFGEPGDGEGAGTAAAELFAGGCGGEYPARRRCWWRRLRSGGAICCATAMQDRIHQPYRMEACPLLPRLLPLAGERRGAGGCVERGRAGGAGDREDGESASVDGRMRQSAGSGLECSNGGVGAVSTKTTDCGVESYRSRCLSPAGVNLTATSYLRFLYRSRLSFVTLAAVWAVLGRAATPPVDLFHQRSGRLLFKPEGRLAIETHRPFRASIMVRTATLRTVEVSRRRSTWQDSL